MRLYIFAIGGTGSRVLKSLVMQLAAGVRPLDDYDEPIKDFTIVPIIIDPHRDNKDVVQTNTLLKDYKSLRTQIYSTGQNDSNPENSFFSVKIETLHDIAATKNSKENLQEGFFFDMPQISKSYFKDFVRSNDHNLKATTRHLTNILISEEELNANMKNGFYGQTNIGTIALNSFKESKTYKAFINSFEDGDRVMFIGSIFGGTGASGMPLLASSMRQEEGNKALRNAPYGAVAVMPYFTLSNIDDKSKIQQNDWNIKTQAALSYYEANLNAYLNAMYYVADPAGTEPITNDPGDNNQEDNTAHIVEYIAALAIQDFAGKNYKDNEVAEFNEDLKRNEAQAKQYFHFSMVEKADKRHNTFDFTDFDDHTLKLIKHPSIRFHLLYRFLHNGAETYYEKNLSKDFSKKNNLTKKAVPRELKNIFSIYEKWLAEIGTHTGSKASNFLPFSLMNQTDDFKKIVYGHEVTGMFNSLNVSDIVGYLNKEEGKVTKEASETSKLFQMANPALTKLVNKKYK